MLVILTDEHILDTGSVCQGCLLANQQGQPRWREGKLGCGHSLGKGGSQQPNLYECQMGFTIANIEGLSELPKEQLRVELGGFSWDSEERIKAITNPQFSLDTITIMAEGFVALIVGFLGLG